eukprot:gnl/TRDRNA2_/TRDRNA2_83481_c0_seq2.p1 gnl/TRDRNA2_/TRDRNA2_83481_c0~~gnl/TRDRNA2_/TRDRNA2_83481_c0_seq2.p1  ORF type:complete len:170 (-),score=30.96 gnl/TRDRNA2_/TRDRNA2_83481_c0_seq2:99-608(-)
MSMRLVPYAAFIASLIVFAVPTVEADGHQLAADDDDFAADGHHLAEDEVPDRRPTQDESSPLLQLWTFWANNQWTIHIVVIGLLVYLKSTAAGASVQYEAGEIAEVRIKPGQDIWLQCKIVGPSPVKKGALDIKILNPDAHEDAKQYAGMVVAATPGSLRKIQPSKKGD